MSGGGLTTPVKMTALFLLLALMVAPGSGFPSGAPSGACSSLMPSHDGASGQTSASPFTITFTPANFTPGMSSPVSVTLSTTSGSTFIGFLLTAMYEGGSVSVRPGSFRNLTSSTKSLCTADSAVTHSSRNSQNSLSFEWMPPATSGGDIRFRATFVRQKTTFWHDVRAADLLVDASVPAGTTSDGSQTNQPPQTVPPTAGKVMKDADCGISKGCFSDCQDDGCSYLITWSPNSSDTQVVQMTMRGKVGAGQYMALGLSEDDKMGGDSVVHCVNRPDGVFLSHNVAGQKYNSLNDKPKDGLDAINVQYVDGVLSCDFTRVKAADSVGQRFALEKEHTLLYAKGPGDENGLSYHDSVKPIISKQAASLVDYTVDITGAASDNQFIKIHGSLMIVAWIFAASIGIVLARYFKDVWQDSTWFGQKIWFQLHRCCMVLALLATATAFIIIFVEVDGYSDIQGKTYQKAHPILGIIVTALTVINPIMALFRPHPGTPRRPIFNWAHWMVGSGAHIIAVITIFFGTLLNTSGAPDYIIYILAAYVGWQVLIQMLLEIVQCVGRRNDRSDAYEMTSINQDPSKITPKAEATFNKRLMLFLHILVITGFTIALIVVLNVGEDES